MSGFIVVVSVEVPFGAGVSGVEQWEKPIARIRSERYFI